MARTSLRKKQAVSYNEDPDDDEMPQVTKAVAAATKVIQKTMGTVTKTVTAKSASVKPATKRKASPEPEIASRAPTAKTTKKRKTKAKDDDAKPLADRTDVSSLKPTMNIGAHVSAAGGVQNSVTNAVHIGANAFALFLKSQRKWTNPPLDHEAKNQFISMCKEHSYSAGEHALPHGSYLVNLAQADEEKADQAYKSFLDDLERCEQLGIRLYNFHPGSTGGDARPAAIARIAAQLNKSHRATKTVITVLENMAGSGNVIGSTWEDLRDIIALVEDKSRVGVCIDTCHAFAAGYDLRTPEAFMNDSKAPFNSNRDLHANIGTGFLGLRAFHSIMNHAPFAGMPMVLETPIDRPGADGKSVEDKKVWANEIKLLERLVGMDAETKEFKDLEIELQAQGESERNKIQDQVDRKMAKDAKKGTKKGGRRKKKDDSDDESE
ncbi:putative AP endonuclease [Fusarium proliferatum ET1]|uniref:Apurinic-apyrimidinic endonuclease 1 n=1 Tax=Fusarium proliferatum (strain ET1) TaxID=1227346 RepID=A0A1L7V316_FUSPR|nr:putative AP endonuclease [Fusarium proliferatum ET1]CVL11082.1 probable AP endonuclease [Fusarium proliferatum]CZR35287.1 probable AP endonuclease [Fusarium proliferatum ET1]